MADRDFDEDERRMIRAAEKVYNYILEKREEIREAEDTIDFLKKHIRTIEKAWESEKTWELKHVLTSAETELLSGYGGWPDLFPDFTDY